MRILVQLVPTMLLLMLVGCGRSKDNTGNAATQQHPLTDPPPSQDSKRWRIEAPQRIAPRSSSDFPVTPAQPDVLQVSDYGLSTVDDSEIASRFTAVSGEEWSALLMEMEKRQSPALVSIMVNHLDEIKCVVRGSGETIYTPELGYPVARVLMDCGEKPIADLISVCTSPYLSLKKRILAARVLRHLGASGHQAADAERIRAALPSSAERLIFNDLWSMAQDDLQVAAVLSDQ